LNDDSSLSGRKGEFTFRGAAEAAANIVGGVNLEAFPSKGIRDGLSYGGFIFDHEEFHTGLSECETRR
jgi:hypothetical protein